MKPLFFREFPQLETKHLILRQLKSSDTEAMFRYLSDPEVTRYLDTQPHQTLEQTRHLLNFLNSFFEQGQGFRWGIVQKSHNSAGPVIGTCGYHAWVKTHRRAEIGYELARSWWGQGVMAEAISALLPFGFEEMGLNRVEAMVLIGNTASAHFLEKLNFQKEGLLKEYEFIQGKAQNVLLFSMLRKDFLSAKDGNK